MCTDSTQSDTPPAIADGDDRTGYDPLTGTFHARFGAGPGADADAVAIAKTVATATDRDVTAMPPLFATVDAEALTALVTTPRDRPVEVSFSYEGCRVTVSSRGDVVVEPFASDAGAEDADGDEEQPR